MTWHQSMGHKGPVLRPRYVGTVRAQTQLLLYTLLSLLGFEPRAIQPAAHVWFRRLLFFITMYLVIIVPRIRQAINPVKDSASLGWMAPRRFGELWFRHRQRLRIPRLQHHVLVDLNPQQDRCENLLVRVICQFVQIMVQEHAATRDTFCQLSRHVAARW
jgi:hypothetical protein